MRYLLGTKEQESVAFVKEDFLHKKMQKKEDISGYLTTNSLKILWDSLKILWDRPYY